MTVCHFVRVFRLFTLNVIIEWLGLNLPFCCLLSVFLVCCLFPLSPWSLFELIDHNLWSSFVSCIILLAIPPFGIFFLMAAFRFLEHINPVNGSLPSGNIIQLHTYHNNPITAYFHFSFDHTLCVCMYVCVYTHTHICIYIKYKYLFILLRSSGSEFVFFTKFWKISAIISSNIPPSFKDFNYAYVKLLTDALIIFFSVFSLYILFWIVSIAVSSSSLIFFSLEFKILLILISSRVFFQHRHWIFHL